MDKALIDKWARETGAAPTFGLNSDGSTQVFISPDALYHFAALVAAHEREQCALVCENYQATWAVSGKEFAKAIRARGEGATRPKD